MGVSCILRMNFCHNLSGLCTLKPKKVENLKNLKLFFLKTSFFQPCTRIVDRQQDIHQLETEWSSLLLITGTDTGGGKDASPTGV